jgi:hypothetical protein
MNEFIFQDIQIEKLLSKTKVNCKSLKLTKTNQEDFVLEFCLKEKEFIDIVYSDYFRINIKYNEINQTYEVCIYPVRTATSISGIETIKFQIKNDKNEKLLITNFLSFLKSSNLKDI